MKKAQNPDQLERDRQTNQITGTEAQRRSYYTWMESGSHVEGKEISYLYAVRDRHIQPYQPPHVDTEGERRPPPTTKTSLLGR
jgi:hypothetical protein